jgi:esterase/lipase superfamily enzyme
MYATDRKPVEDGGNKQRYYDERRSDSLAVGRTMVQFGRDLPWDDLLRESLEPGGRRVPLQITEVQEEVRFPSSIALPQWVDGELREDPAVRAAREASEAAVREELTRRLATSASKEVFVYIHGVGNSFEDPMYRMAELWHYLGRPGVPVVYTWPAVKGGGPLRGYTYARESSEFTVFHLRQFLLAVASCPDVERISIMSHSRGTGVTLSVLRDLRLLYANDAAAARADLKLGNVILAAPDIDLQIAQQRFRPDRVDEILDRLTVYLTPEDKALGIAEFLFHSLTRLGAMTEESLTPEQIDGLLTGRIGVDLIEVDVKKKGAHGHTYWIDNPSVLSDIILILRDDASPGRENGRPMIRSKVGFWEIHDGYPYGGVHADGE